MNELAPFTHLHVILNLYDFLLEYNRYLIYLRIQQLTLISIEGKEFFQMTDFKFVFKYLHV